jgi:hypothetical protein
MPAFRASLTRATAAFAYHLVACPEEGTVVSLATTYKEPPKLPEQVQPCIDQLLDAMVFFILLGIATS